MTTTTTAAYRIEHSDCNVYCQEAYGLPHHPVFTDRDEAVAFMQTCVEAWPVDAPAREMYYIETFGSVTDATEDGHGHVVR